MFFLGKCFHSRLFRRHTGGQIRQDGVAQGDAGQELWQVRAYQVHSPRGTGHYPVRLAVDSGDFSEPQISDESCSGRETHFRASIVKEKEIIFFCSKKVFVLPVFLVCKYPNFVVSL